MATQQSIEEAAFESPDGFALRIKYRKVILCVPVDPRTTYDELAKLSLELLAKTESEVPTETGVETFEDLTENDLAFFQGDSVAGANGLTSDEIQFVEINRTKQSTIGQMGLKDGANAILYIGFRNKSKKSYLQPDVSIPSINDDETEETDQVIEEGKGKSRA